jgi:hypothetical protein
MKNNPAGAFGKPTLGKGQPMGLARPSQKAGQRDSSAGMKSGAPSSKTAPGGATKGGKPGGSPSTVTRPRPWGQGVN